MLRSLEKCSSDKEKERFHNVDALIFHPCLGEEGTKKRRSLCVRPGIDRLPCRAQDEKTASAMDWTSFEHVDNVPEQKMSTRAIRACIYNFTIPMRCGEVPGPGGMRRLRSVAIPRRKPEIPRRFPRNQIARVTTLIPTPRKSTRNSRTIIRGGRWGRTTCGSASNGSSRFRC